MKTKLTKKNRGMTLSEIMMAMTISTVIIAMTGTTLLAGIKLTHKINNINGYDASLRLAYFQISREIEKAIRPPELVMESGTADTGYAKLSYVVNNAANAEETRSFEVVNKQIIWTTPDQSKVIARDILSPTPFNKYGEGVDKCIKMKVQLGRDAQSYSGQASTMTLLNYKSYGFGSDDPPFIMRIADQYSPTGGGRARASVNPTGEI